MLINLPWQPLYLVPPASPGVCNRLSHSVTPVSSCRQITAPKVIYAEILVFLSWSRKQKLSPTSLAELEASAQDGIFTVEVPLPQRIDGGPNNLCLRW